MFYQHLPESQFMILLSSSCTAWRLEPSSLDNPVCFLVTGLCLLYFPVSSWFQSECFSFAPFAYTLTIAKLRCNFPKRTYMRNIPLSSLPFSGRQCGLRNNPGAKSIPMFLKLRITADAGLRTASCAQIRLRRTSRIHNSLCEILPRPNEPLSALNSEVFPNL